jgi:hypothetical protein
MQIRKFYGRSGKVYFVTLSKKSYWTAFVETQEGFVPVVAKTAAYDCNAKGDPETTNTHQLWGQLWPLEKKAA